MPKSDLVSLRTRADTLMNLSFVQLIVLRLINFVMVDNWSMLSVARVGHDLLVTGMYDLVNPGCAILLWMIP